MGAPLQQLRADALREPRSPRGSSPGLVTEVLKPRAPLHAEPLGVHARVECLLLLARLVIRHEDDGDAGVLLPDHLLQLHHFGTNFIHQ